MAYSVAKKILENAEHFWDRDRRVKMLTTIILILLILLLLGAVGGRARWGYGPGGLLGLILLILIILLLLGYPI